MASKERIQKLRIGFFVLGGFALLLAMLFVFGLSDLFTHKAAVRTFFSESVQGLTVGSPVKYRGVPIGTVSRISIRVADKLVQVNMDIELDHFVDVNSGRGQQLDEFHRFFQTELEQGMRCRLEYTGITGMRYIDFDYFATPGQTLPEPPAYALAPTELYIPAVPSSFHDILKALGTSLERISRIRFEEISDGMERSLAELSGLLSDPALKSMILRLNDAAENLDSSSSTIARVFSEEQLTRLSATLEKSLLTVNKLGDQLLHDAQAARVPESTAAFREAAAAVVELRVELSNMLLKLNQMIDSVSELSDVLRQDPNSLLRGRAATPAKEH